MKVLHLTTHLNTGGITIYILRLLKRFEERDVQTVVVSGGGEYTEAFRARGARVFELPMKTKSELNPNLYLNLPKLIKIVRDNQISVIHAHTRVAQVMAFWVQAFTKVPVVTTYHGFYTRRLGRRINPAWGDRAIAISSAVGEHLVKDHKLPQNRLRVVNNGIDFDEMDKACRTHDGATAKIHFGFARTDPVIGNVARLVPDKGQEYLIRALEVVKAKFPNIRLLVVGEGRNRMELENLVETLNLKANVFFTGNLKDVTYALAAMDIFAFPATWKEGFGLSIVEAIACHKPVIVTDVWALNDLITDRENGLIVEPKSSGALAEAITLLLEDKELREKIEVNAFRMAEENFSLERMASEILDVYKEVTGLS